MKSNSCSRDYVLVRCTAICPVHKDHHLLHLLALEIHAHHLTSTVLLSCRRPLPRPPLQYLVSHLVQLRMCSARNLELLLFLLPPVLVNCHIYTLVGTASVNPAVDDRALDCTQSVLELSSVCHPPSEPHEHMDLTVDPCCKSNILSNPACLRARMLFRMAASPAHISFHVV